MDTTSITGQAQEPASEEQKAEIKEKLHDINKKLITMEWDKRHNQLNAGMESKYTQLKAEQDKLLKQISGTTPS